MIDVDHVAALEALDARALEVAAFHDDHGVAGIVDLVDDLDLGDTRGTPATAAAAGRGSRRARLCRDAAAHRPSPATSRPRRHPAAHATSTTNRCRWRIASATCARVASALAIVIVLVGRVLFSGPGGTALRVFLVQIAQDLLDAILVCHRFVESELELRHAPQLQASRRRGGGRTASRAAAPWPCPSAPSRRPSSCSRRAPAADRP